MTLTFPPPVVQVYNGIFVVREDAFPGGTKRRFVDPFVMSRADAYDEFVYATTAYGGAQIALAHACARMQRQAVVFVAKRNELHERTAEAKRVGASIVEVPMGFLSNVQSKARAYCATRPRSFLMPFGFDSPEARAAIRDAALEVRRRLGQFEEAWCAVGSGTLIRALQEARLARAYHGVLVGRDHAEAGAATLVRHPQDFGADAPKKDRPPFPSCANYDAKAWRYARESWRLGKRIVFWNVMA